jgi:aryl-alcohol dehydrogenase-like predicted oxidoreductase
MARDSGPRRAFRPSRLTLGCGGFGVAVPADAAADLVARALDWGVATFDTADSYGGGRSESILGRALGARREGAVLVSKTGGTPPGGKLRGSLGRRELAAACEASLRRLGTDRIDLYLLHRLRPGDDVAELCAGFGDLVREGKILAYGFGNASPAALSGAAALSGTLDPAPSAYQGEFSLAVRAAGAEIAPLCRREGWAFMAYSPFAGGHLLRGKPETGRFREAAPGLLRSHREKIAEAARLFGATPAQAALSWVLSRPWVTTAVFGASGADQLRQAVDGARPAPELNRFLDADPVPELTFD